MTNALRPVVEDCPRLLNPLFSHSYLLTGFGGDCQSLHEVGSYVVASYQAAGEIRWPNENELGWPKSGA
jgi:hypothetical protein